jgi:hypothetical protein
VRLTSHSLVTRLLQLLYHSQFLKIFFRFSRVSLLCDESSEITLTTLSLCITLEAWLVEPDYMLESNPDGPLYTILHEFRGSHRIPLNKCYFF